MTKNNQRIPWNVMAAEEHQQEAYEERNNENPPLQRANQELIAPRQNPVGEGNLMQIQGSDHPGMQLVAFQLTGTNYLTWNHSIKIALGAINKIGFVDGTIIPPALASPNYVSWKCADYMVIEWILNSISKEFVRAFRYAKSAKQLWDDTEQHLVKAMVLLYIN